MSDLDKEFPLQASISRQKLKDLGCTDEEIAQFTDDDMVWIAEIMTQNFHEGLMDDNLHHLATLVLREKEQLHD